MKIYTNSRGICRDGKPFDGRLDGWHWQSWSGGIIAYGATEKDAVASLRRKLTEPERWPRQPYSEGDNDDNSLMLNEYCDLNRESTKGDPHA